MNRFAALASGALLLGAAACSVGQSATPSSSTAPGPAGQSASSPSVWGEHDVALAPMPTGTVTLTWDRATQMVSAKVDMTGFTPGESHAMHIHPGTCASQTAPPSVPFPDITADSTGRVHETVKSQTEVPKGIPAASYVNIHLAPSPGLGSPGSLGFTPIACADIPAGTPAGVTATLKVTAPARDGHPPSGAASLAYDAATHRLTVDVRATGLPPNSSHAVHIHAGSCARQGGVAYGLPDLRTDASGTGNEKATVAVTGPPPPTGWYLNVHFGPMARILAGDKPTMEFAPVLCGDVR
ncbi:CHRD domain-containing protein [Tsukamurella sp. 8F]|uniref:CHRD domain-containing protein n=1 Tax=unclassified Tsukamurella TaxID=2633480 RepID=UPI0023B8C98D|nr:MULTISPECIES: CHRD domain-containing protein [unclassified Tsukamurella]MDF0531543.1 CHRD domain-containing protein [Tsukamurella sp. 8J]MDF0588845.1 CHRD domain-containing protein [Tsukamurella sp. 8F]